MPRNARLLPAGWDTLEYSIGCSVSVSHSGLGTGKWDYNLSGQTRYADSAFTSTLGITLNVQSHDGVGGSGASATFALPDLHYSTSWSDTAFHSALKLSCRFRNVKPYVTDGSQIKYQCGSVEIWLNDVTLLQTHPGVDLNSVWCGPSYVPTVGYPFQIFWGPPGAATDGLPGTLPSTYDALSETTQTISDCGVRFKVNSGDPWETMPIATLTPVAPGLSAPSFGIGFGAITATSSYGDIGLGHCINRNRRYFIRTDYATMSIRVVCTGVDTEDGGGAGASYGPYTGACEASGVDGPAKRDYYDTEQKLEYRSGDITLFPNWESAIKKINTDYCALWYRDALPQATALGSHNWIPKSGTGGAITADPGVSDALEPLIYPRLSEDLDRVTNAASVIEQAFSYPVYCPVVEGIFHSEYHDVQYIATGACKSNPSWFTPPACPAHTVGSVAITVVYPDPPSYTSGNESKSWQFPYAVDDKYSVPQLLTAQYHEDPLLRLWAFWGNRHWQYGLYYPVNGAGGTQTLWQIDSAGIEREYFTETRQQEIYHPSLPSGQRTKERVANSTSCLDDSAHTPFLDTYFYSFRWIGTSRWLTQAIALAFTQYTSASSGLWTLTNCTGAFGANLVLTPSSSSIVAELSLGDFAGEGYLAAHLAGSFVLNWSATNITALHAYLVGLDGTKTLLASTPGTYAKPSGSSSKYAGSWAIDNGGGYFTDVGTDASANGVSADTMTDPERCTAFQLGPERTYAKLRFEITVTNPAATVTLNYPGLVAPSTVPKIIYENGQCCTAVYPDGPAIRIGNWQVYDEVFDVFLNPPAVNGLGYKGTIVDALSTKRLLLLGASETGGSPDLTTELTTIFDTFEVQSVAASDANSIFVILQGPDNKIYFGLINTVAEIPPLAIFPRKARDSHWDETGAYSLHAWDQSFAVKGLVCPVEAPHLFNSGGAQVSVPVSDPASGYKENAANLALNGNETGYQIKTSSLDMGRVRPGPSGYFCVLSTQHTTNGDCDLHQSKLGEHIQTDTPDGNLRVSWSDHTSTNWARRIGVTAGQAYAGRWSSPRLVTDDNTQAILHAYHTNQGGGDPLASGLYEFTSTDNGTTWSSPTSIGTGAHSMIRAAKDGGPMMNVVYVADSGTSGPGSFKSRWKAVPDAAWSSFSVMKDKTGATLRTAGGYFGFDHAREEEDRWWINFMPEVGTDPATYWCANKGDTWDSA